jgi:dTDP-4-dehydrorhamnose reductase
VKRLLLTGASGLLGSNLLRSGRERFDLFGLCSPRDPSPPGPRVDLTNARALRDAVEQFRPDVILHAGAMTGPVDCEKHPDEAMRVNVDATRLLASLAAEHGARFLFLSTDLVFDGNKGMYREEDPVGPLSHYGRTKVLAEQATHERMPAALIVRTTLMVGFSPRGNRSVNEAMQTALDRGETLRLFRDEYRSIIGVGNLAEALLELADSTVTGVLHLAGPERRSRYDWGLLIARRFGWDLSRLQPVTRAEMPMVPPRPADVSLDIGRARRVLKTPIQSIEEVLDAMLPENQ